jgi:hypothetical protein
VGQAVYSVQSRNKKWALNTKPEGITNISAVPPPRFLQMGLDDICAEFQMSGGDNFLESLRIYGADGDHCHQEVIERL